MRTRKLDKLDKSILESKALFRFQEFVKGLVKSGKSMRTVQYRTKKLKVMGFLDATGGLTEAGKEVVARMGNLREDALPVESHGFSFKCHVLRKPGPKALEKGGWRHLSLREWQGEGQWLLRNRSVFYHLTGETLTIHVPAIKGSSPINNSLDASKTACAAAETLCAKGWRLETPVACKPSHHVFNFLKLVAQKIYEKIRGIDLIGVLVDDSKGDGGEFEVLGETQAEQLMKDIATLPDFKDETRQRLERLEKQQGVKPQREGVDDDKRITDSSQSG